MSPVFTPPTIADRPPFLEDSDPQQVGLWRHYETRNRGVDVWKLSDGSYVQDTATAENSNTNLQNVYPWDPDNPTAPYVYVHNFDGTVTTVSHNPYVVAFYPGGHANPVSSAEASALTAYTAHGSGYGGNIT